MLSVSIDMQQLKLTPEFHPQKSFVDVNRRMPWTVVVRLSSIEKSSSLFPDKKHGATASLCALAIWFTLCRLLYALYPCLCLRAQNKHRRMSIITMYTCNLQPAGCIINMCVLGVSVPLRCVASMKCFYVVGVLISTPAECVNLCPRSVLANAEFNSMYSKKFIYMWAILPSVLQMIVGPILSAWYVTY